MNLSRAQLDGNLDQLEADLPGLLESSSRTDARAALRTRGDEILRSAASEDDRRHARERIEAMTREHGLG
ncbi:hypothetical protein [Dokdonella sp.]|uniref:hypothetical protein n=1 Tax=Dokdonella sp. TaxID=2291710 RepID=UPI002F40814A